MKPQRILLMAVLATLLAGSFLPIQAKTLIKGRISRPCDAVFGTLYTELRAAGSTGPVQVTIDNNGDCTVNIFANGVFLFSIPFGVKARAVTAAPLPPGGTITYFCSFGLRATCKFKFRVRE